MLPAAEHAREVALRVARAAGAAAVSSDQVLVETEATADEARGDSTLARQAFHEAEKNVR